MKIKPKKLLSLAMTAAMLCGLAVPAMAAAAPVAETVDTVTTELGIPEPATPETAATAPRFSLSVGAESLDGFEHINEDLFNVGDTTGEMDDGQTSPLLVQVEAPGEGASLIVTLDGPAVFADTGNAESVRTFENGEEAAVWLLNVQVDGDFTATAAYTDGNIAHTKTLAVTMQDGPALFAESNDEQYHITGVSKVGGEWLITFEGTDMSFCLDKGLDGQPSSSVYWTYHGTTDILEKAAAAGCTSKLEIQKYVWEHRDEAGDSGSAYVYAASQLGWQNVVTTFGSGGGDNPEPPTPPEPTPPPTYDASWSVNVTESAAASFSVSMTVGVDKYANVTQEKLSDAEITVTPAELNGALDGGNWGIDPASQIIRTVNGDGSVTFIYSGAVSKSASRSDGGRVSGCTSQEEADNAADDEKSDAENRLRGEAKASALAQANAAANVAAEIARQFILSETGIPYGFDATADSNQTQTVQPNGSVTAGIANQPWKATVKWEKLDALTGGRLTEDTEFDLYEWDVSSENYEISPNYRVVRLADGTYTVSVTNATYKDWDEGCVYFTQKNIGKFKIAEKTPACGYTPNTQNGGKVWTVEFAIDQQDKVVEYLGAKADKNRPWGNKIIIDKVDSETGNRIAGDAVFSLYEWNQARGLYEVSTNYGVVRSSDGSYTVQCLHDDWALAEYGYLYFEDTLCDTRENTANSDGTTSTHAKFYTDYDMANYPNVRANTNDGQFLIVEHTAPAGYYGDWTDLVNPGTAGSDLGKRAYYLRLTGDGSTIVLSNADYNADITAADSGSTRVETASGIVTIAISPTAKNADRVYTTDATGLANNEDTRTVKANGEALKNDRVLGEITLTKVDLDAMKYLAAGSNGETTLDGAVYDLYAAENILHPDGVSGIVDYAKITENGAAIWHTTVLTNGGGWDGNYLPVLKKDALVASAAIQNGRLVFANLYLGKYYLVERATGLVLPIDNAGKYYTTGSCPLLNRKLERTGNFKALAKNSGGEYTDYLYKNQYSAVAEGRALNSSKTYDGYYLSYATGYLCDEVNHYKTLTYGGEAAYVNRVEQQSEDEVLKGGFSLNKLVSTTGQPSPAIKLKGAGFTVYRIADLSKAAQFKKAADGSYDAASVLDAYRKDSYDNNTKKYDFTAEGAAVVTMYESSTVTVESYNATLTADVDNANGSGVGWQPTGAANEYRLGEIFSNEDGILRVEGLPYGQYLVAETTIPKDVFQADPFIVKIDSTVPQSRFSIPAGSVTTPSNSYLTYNILDEELEGYLQLVKIDAETGKAVKMVNTSFSIYYITDGQEKLIEMNDPASGSATKKTSVFTTDENGQMKTPEKLPLGKYRIVELEGPQGFYNDAQYNVVFELTSERVWQVIGNSADDMDDYIIAEEYANHETLGQLTIRKQGEVLIGFENGQFIYEKDNLAGAEYAIYAKGNVATGDRQGTLWYADGDLVATVTTGENGQVDKAVFAPTRTQAVYPFLSVTHNGNKGEVTVTLPLGTYEIKETKAPYGFVLSDAGYTVSFGWESQSNDIVLAKSITSGTGTTEYGVVNAKDASTEELEKQVLVFTNERVVPVPDQPGKIGVGIYKRDRDTNKLLAGAVFELYTKDTIYSAAGDKLAEADTLLATSSATDANGFAWFAMDVPIRNAALGNTGNYYIVERTAPDGYFLDKTQLPVSFTYENQYIAWQIVNTTATNEFAGLAVRKIDVGGRDLAGATLQITDSAGVLVDQWVTDGSVHQIPVVAVDEATPGSLVFSKAEKEYSYTLIETAAPAGYEIASAIQFKTIKTEGGGYQVFVRTDVNTEWQLVDDTTLTMIDRATPTHDDSPQLTPAPTTPPTVQPTATPAPVLAIPQTGDAFPLLMFVGIAVAAGIGLGIFAYKHKHEELFEDEPEDDE